jgi:hypothetical protein
VSEYQRQLQHGGAFVGIDEEQRRQQEERLQRSHAELSSHRIDSGGGGGGEYDDAGGQIVEDEDEALEHLDRNSDYNPHQAASPAVDAASRRSHETDSLRQLHHLLGGVQASMLRDPGAPPLNPNEIDDSATRGRASKYNEQPAQAAAGGGGGRSSGSGFGDDGGAGVLHALHRALKQESRDRAVKQ